MQTFAINPSSQDTWLNYEDSVQFTAEFSETDNTQATFKDMVGEIALLSLSNLADKYQLTGGTGLGLQFAQDCVWNVLCISGNCATPGDNATQKICMPAKADAGCAANPDCLSKNCDVEKKTCVGKKLDDSCEHEGECVSTSTCTLVINPPTGTGKFC